MILWRRIAGGLSTGQQRAIAEPLFAPLRDFAAKRLSSRGRDRSSGSSDALEMWYLLGSLELLPVPLKIEFGELTIKVLEKGRADTYGNALVWALGRLGERVPVYGPLNTIVPRENAAQWLNVLLSGERAETIDQLAVMQLARRTNDRYRDLDESERDAAVRWLEQHGARQHLIELVRDGGELDTGEQGQVYGESLPKGLRIS
jgi:hypothetical protein